jgi:queuine tRNA-ribosyltransferase accessory subunit
VLVLGARRTPPVAAPAANPNTNDTIAVCTAVGFKALDADEYTEHAEQMKADILVALADVPSGRSLGSKRIEKATDRSIQWIMNHVQIQKQAGADARQAKLFASLLPVSCANQQFYIDCLTQDISGNVAGLAFHDLSSLEDLPEPLHHLPRLGFTTPATPHEVLRQIALGIDVLTIPFIGAATDAGIALDFSFPVPSTSISQCPQPLGIDIWDSSHAVNLLPLTEGCQCYACTNHHRAYVQHLLNAKEMLAWVLLQIHNHHVIDLFFAGIRRSIVEGTFDTDVEGFARAYESQLPEKTGQGPR